MERKSGTWKKGQSGNPKGRPPKPTSELIARQLKHGRAALIRQLEKLAYEGDTQAVKFLVDKLYPARKLTMQPIVLPALTDREANLTDKAHAILGAVGSGELPPDLGRELLSALSGVARVAEIDELEARISALEQQNDSA